MVYWVECSPMARETRSSHTTKKKMVLDISLLNTQHYKVCINGKVVPFCTPQCSSHRKKNHRVALDYGRQLYWQCCLSHRFYNCMQSSAGFLLEFAANHIVSNIVWSLLHYFYWNLLRSKRGAVVNELDCHMIVSEFEL